MLRVESVCNNLIFPLQISYCLKDIGIKMPTFQVLQKESLCL